MEMNICSFFEQGINTGIISHGHGPNKWSSRHEEHFRTTNEVREQFGSRDLGIDISTSSE